MYEKGQESVSKSSPRPLLSRRGQERIGEDVVTSRKGEASEFNIFSDSFGADVKRLEVTRSMNGANTL